MARKLDYTGMFATLRPVMTDTTLLHLCRTVYRDREQDAHFNTQLRVHYIRIIKECQEDGHVSVVSGGMDCDCVQYEGHVRTVPATVDAVDAAIEDLSINAEGPIHWEVMAPSKACNVKQTSRDLALEAFEDGHPWIIHA